MAAQRKISERTVERISRYRRLLESIHATSDNPFIYSHEIASLCGLTAAQVRRDLMTIGFSGSSARGYEVAELLRSASSFLGFSHERRMALVGIGYLGRALLDYFVDRNPLFKLCAAFDADPGKVDRVIHGVRCYPVTQLKTVLATHQVSTGIITVPADAAQNIAWELVEAGVTGILNFAPVQIRVPANVFIENLDLTSALEKVAYFAGNFSDKERTKK
ncbi:MAG: redox-sensing transcriptional repressor Rex [Proteobacteria bacterium]|jgi:redox-sensing transcriptional repressor|nr:redox-sensing transcriptional repressor Rex [Pseudomonadota bacterium]NLN63652.1 redox-sensing transcriptional repressor Rex [Myxococcales bacterium]